MATKSFKEICVEYAHQLGKGLPLTPAEMCNAVIMYLNAQITEMQGITTALQTAVSEAESSATEAINKADDVSETVNALPKVPTPTTSDNGKVIGVQSGVYALVEQSGGEAPANMVTTDTAQTISGNKYFKYAGFEYNNKITIRNNDTPMYGVGFPNKGAGAYTFALTDDIPEVPEPTASDNGKVIGVENGAYALVEQSGGEAPANMVTTDTKQTVTAQKTYIVDDSIIAQFSDGQGNFIDIGRTEINMNGFRYAPNKFGTMPSAMINVPNKAGTLALTDDIPDVTNLVTTNTEQNITATKNFSIIKCGEYSIQNNGFFYSTFEILRYSVSSQTIQLGHSAYNVNIVGKTLKYNGKDIGPSSGGKLYNHYISCTVTGIGITSALKIYFNFISTSGTVLTDMNDLSEAIKNQFLSCKGNLAYSVGGDSAIPIYITSDGSNISMGYITQETNNSGEEALTALDTFHFSDSVNEI